MRKFLILIILFLSLFYSVSNARKIQAQLTYASFYSATAGPYVETYLSVLSKSCVYAKENDGKWRANLNVLIMFKQDTIIRKFKKYNLSSLAVDDTAGLTGNFIDIQRFLLKNGNYMMEIKITDNNNPGRTLRNKDSVYVKFSDNSISISDIEFLESYKQATGNRQQATVLEKCGYDMVPQIRNFFPESLDRIKFYFEIYNTEKVLGTGHNLPLQYYIEGFESQLAINDFIKKRKESSKTVIALLSEFDISNLPSGNYNFVVELRDGDNKLLASGKEFFQRSNPGYKLDLTQSTNSPVENTFAGKIDDKKRLDDYIRSLYPISSITENKFVEHELEHMELNKEQSYFYNFWLSRNKQNPEKAWLEYYEQVVKVNSLFSTRIKRGYETERGRVYLKYGAPSTIVDSQHEPSAYPYEIWHYHQTANQNDVRFVFYEPDLVTNDYELLHSTATGEIHNDQWEMVIYGRNTPPGNIDQTTPQMHYGSHADDYYNLPR